MTSHCVYCGAKTRGGRCCPAHSDLKRLDPWWYHDWWQERFTPREIRELAWAIGPEHERVAA